MISTGTEGGKREGSTYVPALGLRVLTPLYDRAVALTTRERRFRGALIAQAVTRPELDILDLGCGTGSLTIGIKRREPSTRIVGVDGDPEVLRIATRKAAAAEVLLAFDCALAHELPYAGASFDRVVSSLFFHHLTWQSKQQAAAEAYRVLRPGGELHVADWGRPSGPTMRALFLIVQALDGVATTRDNVAGRLPELFVAAGFEQVVQEGHVDTMLGTIALYRARRPE